MQFWRGGFWTTHYFNYFNYFNDIMGMNTDLCFSVMSNIPGWSHCSCPSLTHTLCHSTLAKHTIYLDWNSYTLPTLIPTLLHLVFSQDSPFKSICYPSAALLPPPPPRQLNLQPSFTFCLFSETESQVEKFQCALLLRHFHLKATHVNHLPCVVYMEKKKLIYQKSWLLSTFYL